MRIDIEEVQSKQRSSAVTARKYAEPQPSLVVWNNPSVPYAARNLPLHRLFEEQVKRTPDKRALVFEQQSLTYGELDQRADHVARHLRTMGVGPDILVGLLVDRSPALVVGILGILKAGGAYVPMDVSYPSERIAFMLGDAKVAMLLTQSSLLATLPNNLPPVVCIDTMNWHPSNAPLPDDVQLAPENLAYVIYTSGSTGKPKGVCIEHGNIVNYVLDISERLQFEPGMHHATVSTIAADLGNTVIFPALITGGCLHVISRERAENQALLGEYFTREGIDVLKIVPSHLAALQTGRNPELTMPRKRLILGGESSRLDWIDHLRTLSPSCQIFNHYGPTETTVGVMTYSVGSQLPATQSGTLPLGKPLPSARIYILDEAGHPVAAGEQGELYVGGNGVARGYLNRPELTGTKFVGDPFSSEPDARLYRTGDRARYLADGNVEFCGRADDQIKFHGHRVELGEIEAALREQSGVRDAVVLASQDGSGSQQLVAYIVPERTDQPLWDCKSSFVLPDGAAVAHLNRSETEYIYDEIFVRQAYLRHGITIQDGDCILDAGANIGLFSVFASRMARNLRMLCFEPNPAAFACLTTNVDARGMEAKCLPFGLSSENKSADLTFFDGMSLLSGFFAAASTEREVVKRYLSNLHPELLDGKQLPAEIGEMVDDRFRSRTMSVPVRTLSSVIAEERIDRINLLKINVEKSELDVLNGIGPADWPKIRQLVIEVDRQENLHPMTSLLEENGFVCVVEQDPLLRETDLCYVYAVRSPADKDELKREPSLSPVACSPSTPERELLTPALLRRQLKERLPHYMVPSAFVLMEQFPLTSNGKIDRQALPASFRSSVPPSCHGATPETETERALATIWTRLLKIETIGTGDDLFDLGAHSLLAMRAVTQIRETFGVNLHLRSLFEHPTIAGLAALIDDLSLLAPVTSGDTQDREEISF